MNIETHNKREINIIIIILVIIDTLLLLISSFTHLANNVLTNIYYFDLVVCVILWIEFIYDIYHSKNRKEYLKKNWYYIIAIIPLDFFFIRAFRFVGIIRIFKLTRILILFNKSRKDYKKFVEIYLDKLIIAILIFVIISTVALFIIEPSFNSLFETFWYVIVTLTSVGYGDTVPETSNGKILAIIIILVGIIFFSVFTAAIASIYIKKINESSEISYEKRLNDLRSQINDLIIQLEMIEEYYQLETSNELDRINDKIDNISDSIEEISRKLDK